MIRQHVHLRTLDFDSKPSIRERTLPRRQLLRYDRKDIHLLLGCRQLRFEPRVVDLVAEVLEAAHEAEIRLQRVGSPPLAAALADARGQFAALIYPHFVSETGLRRLPDLVRYLRAISRRLDTAAADPGRDATRMAVVRAVTEAYRRAIADLPATRHSGQDVQAVRCMIEELRVSLFAQLLGTSGPVSEKRIHAALDRLIGPR